VTRYITKSSGWVEDEVDYDTESFHPSLDVDGPVEIDTGLISANGDRIYRLPPPIGFGRNDEW